jgi:hypothetical protein
MPFFSFRNSSVSTKAILASGRFADCVGAVVAGVPAGFGWAKTEEALTAAKKTIAAIARDIFISVL